MKKTLLATAAALALTAGAAIPAQASETSPNGVSVWAQVDFAKLKVVNTLVFDKVNVRIDVDGWFRGKTGAEADAVVNQTNTDNTVDTAPYQEVEVWYDHWGRPHRRLVIVPLGRNTLRASINNSVNGNAGVTQVNQDVGYSVNQGNVLSAAVAKNAYFADANASVQQTTAGNALYGYVNEARARISGSVNKNVGVTMVNQNVGAMNNQNNTVSLALGKDATVALAEADLGQFNTNNNYDEYCPNRSSTITSSVNGNTGVTTVNQTSGNMNNQSTTISISGAVHF
jgi:hypothetical protein